jgi:RHS repeat-associated protein
MLDAFGLINMNGRVYGPVIARFLSPDNYVQSPTSSQGFNRYSYCLNNPLVYTDPDGNNPIIAAMIIGAMINVAAQGIAGNIHSYVDFALAAGVGALAGAAGGLAGQAAAQAISTGGFAGGAIVGANAGMAGGFVGGAGNAWANGANFNNGMYSGISGAGMGTLMGGVTGGIASGFDVIQYNKDNPFDLKNIWTGENVHVGRTPFSFINNKPVDVNDLYYVDKNGNVIHLTQYNDQNARKIYPIYNKTRGGILDQYNHSLDLETKTTATTSAYVKIPQGYKIKGAVGIESDKYYWPIDGGVEFSTNTGSSIIVHTGPNNFRLSPEGLKYIDANIWGSPYGSDAIYSPNNFKVVIRISK